MVRREIFEPGSLANGMTCGASDTRRVLVMPDACVPGEGCRKVVGGTGIEPVAPPV